jgi:hypothetical protein
LTVTKTGIISVIEGESRLDGELLARKGYADEVGEGTNFLARQKPKVRNGDRATVTGDEEPMGNVTVIYMTSAQRANAKNAGS